MHSVDNDQFWWPHPDSFSELTVNDSENGFELVAPDDSEVGQWISYYNSSDELREEFNTKLVEELREHVNRHESQEKIDG
jgi:hypothetical protein